MVMSLFRVNVSDQECTVSYSVC